ncbi:MAG TPA: SDR family oxidoreductase [Candidatus Nanopelagicaceae bacterium]|nr:SDR family oxidoreductase [Candidatus Nanopelagicaceae bacterium]
MPRQILVTGATGYVGGRLVRNLVADGFQVRVLVRDADKLTGLLWRDAVEIIEGDASDPEALRLALGDVHTAFYLLHSLDTGRGFAKTEKDMALIFGRECAKAKVAQIVYLGGIANDKTKSEHLASRVDAGEALAQGGVPTMELRAGIIIGSGSASFEMLRHLTERLPIIPAPRWVNNRTHPIAIRDVLWYLERSAQLKTPVSGVFDLGGPDIFTYAEMMHRYAKVAGLRGRTIIPIPVHSPRLCGLWVNLVTPVPVSISRPLIGSIINEVVADPAKSVSAFIPEPAEGLVDFEHAVELALARSRDFQVITRWSDATGNFYPSERAQGDPAWAGASAFRDVRVVTSTNQCKNIWASIERIGGENGWYGSDWAWELRGFIDRLIGGVGLRRGRRDPEHLRIGDSLDFWRVEALEENVRLRLLAEMKLPGVALLEFRLTEEKGIATLTQEATFLPKGVWGHLYWWLVSPFHTLIFLTMARNIVHSADPAQTK